MKLTDGVIENPFAVFYDDGTPLLEHYGVKGMHWGVRNSETLARYSRERKANKARKIEAKNIKKKRKAAEKTRKQQNIVNKEKNLSIRKDRINANNNRALLSEKELDTRIRRLQKERQLNLLTQQELSPGRYAVKKALTNVGTELIKTDIRSGAARLKKTVSGLA